MRGCARRAARRSDLASDRIGIVVGLRAEARLAAPLVRRLDGIVAVGGGGAAGAGVACARLIGAGVGGLVSFGLAGGLDPALGAGTLLCPAEVLAGGQVFAADATLAGRLGQILHGRILGGEHVLAGAGAKQAAFAASGAAAIDLESGAVARAAAAAGLPFAVLRAIADPAGRSLPAAALAGIDAAGKLRIRPLLGALARHPGDLRALFGLAREAALARRALLRAVGNG